MKPPAPVTMWAAIVRNKRHEWIHYETLHRTRLGARALYLEKWLIQFQEEALKRVRFARVTVAMAAPADPKTEKGSGVRDDRDTSR